MSKALAVIPSVPVWVDGDAIIFDLKFYSGMLEYKKEWLGDISCVMRKSNEALPVFGIVRKKRDEIPFGLTVLLGREKITYDHLKGASIVLASGDSFDQFHIGNMCKKNNIKCVYVIEYIPETRYQILNIEKINPIVKLRRFFFLWCGERKRLAAFKAADGVQTNGTAAYLEYKKFKNCHLYFDTRVDGEVMISDDELDSRLAQLSQHRQLQLAFSGRLINMKGADHLIKLAGLLKNRNINFKMSIFGTGDLHSTMSEEINQMNLNDEVELRGPVDFYATLLPEIKANIDLYVVLHRQSDPSCTYLETLSCGIPIVGYANRSLKGLLQTADVGWGAKINDLEGIADVIENLNNHRALITEKSKKCLGFARHHDFTSCFKGRIKHLKQLVE